MNDDFEPLPDDPSDLDDLFPDLGKPAPKAAKSPVPTRKPNAPPSHELNWTEIRPVAKSRDEAIVCLTRHMVCETCAGTDTYVVGVFLKRIHLHHSPVTELIRLEELDNLPPLPREIQGESHQQPICWTCISRLGFQL